MKRAKVFHQSIYSKGGVALVGVSALIMGIGCRRATTTETAETPARMASAAKPAEEKPAVPEPRFKRFKKPETVKGLYLTAWGAGSTKRLDNMIALLDRTEL